MKQNFEVEDLVMGEESGAREDESKSDESAEMPLERELVERQETPQEAAETIALMRAQFEGLKERLTELEAEKGTLFEMSPQANKFARMYEIDAEILDV